MVKKQSMLLLAGADLNASGFMHCVGSETLPIANKVDATALVQMHHASVETGSV